MTEYDIIFPFPNLPQFIIIYSFFPNPLLSHPPFSMATTSIFLLISLLTFTTHAHSTSLYLSPSPKTLFSNYNKMLNSFKIFIYPSHDHPTSTPLFTTPQESQFHKSLIKSPFITQDPTHAHLFFLPFPSSSSTRSIARLIKNIRTTFPYWNRTLGADHFYLSSTGVDSSSDRNIVELKKNSIQISCFPTISGLFIPHKDITLPPVHQFQVVNLVNASNVSMSLTGYLKLNKPVPLSLINKLNGHPDFKVEYNVNNKFTKNSKFCLFVYGYDDMTWIVEAMGSRCVPVVITDRPIQDLPLMDVIDWSEVAVFVGTSGGVDGLKRVLDEIKESRYEEMMESGVTATRHLVWNEEPQPQDVFHMIVYQLWLRRHTIRYARWVE